jgi:hypothetical protein
LVDLDQLVEEIIVLISHSHSRMQAARRAIVDPRCADEFH